MQKLVTIVLFDYFIGVYIDGHSIDGEGTTAMWVDDWADAISQANTKISGSYRVVVKSATEFVVPNSALPQDMVIPWELAKALGKEHWWL